MALKFQSRTKSGIVKKSKISTKVIAAIIVGIVAIAGIVIVFNSFASGPPAYQYSYNATCEKKSTNINVKTNQIVTTTGADIVTVPVDPKSDCVKNSAEAQSYRLYRATNGKDPDYKSYSELVQKMAGDRIQSPELVPQSFLDQYKTKSDAEFVTKVFQNVLYRTPADSGAAWAAEMKKNGWSRRDAVYIISSSAEAKNNNTGKFSEFISENTVPVTVNQTAQKAQNARAEEATKIVEGMRIVSYSILVLRNEINAAGSYAKAKPKQDEASKLMISVADAKKKFDDLYFVSTELSKNTAGGISDAKIKELKSKADEYLNVSWAGAVEAGRRAEKYKTDEANARIAASRRTSSSRNNRSGSTYRYNPPVTPTRTPQNNCPGFTNGQKVETESRQLPVDKGRSSYTETRQRIVFCSNGNITYGKWSIYQ